jgi:hypothetical protein
MRRRTFLKSVSWGAGFVILKGGALTYAANEKLRVGAIGIAGQGAYNINNVAAAGGEIVALCDVHTSRKEVAAMRERFPNASFYTDYRLLLDKEKLDAVIVSTPDHTHAPATLLALKAGCHVYCEKPLTHTVHEARLVSETARKYKRVTQMGTQIHAGSNYRRVVEWIESGAIGEVREVHVWCGSVVRRRGSAEGDASGSRRVGLGFVAGTSALSSLPSDLRAILVATVVGLWWRDPGRHGLPLHRPGVLGVKTAASHSGRCRGA